MDWEKELLDGWGPPKPKPKPKPGNGGNNGKPSDVDPAKDMSPEEAAEKMRERLEKINADAERATENMKRFGDMFKDPNPGDWEVTSDHNATDAFFEMKYDHRIKGFRKVPRISRKNAA